MIFWQKTILGLLGIFLISACGDIAKKNKSRTVELVYQLSWESENFAKLKFAKNMAEMRDGRLESLVEQPQVYFIMQCCNSRHVLGAKKVRSGEYTVDTKSLPRDKDWHILIYYKNEKIIGNLDTFKS